MLLRYKPKKYDDDITLIVSEEGEKIDAYLGWENIIGGTINKYRIDGNHMAYLRKSISLLGRTLNQCIEQEGTAS